MKIKMYERKDTFIKSDTKVVVTRLSGLKCPAKELACRNEWGLAQIMCSYVSRCIHTGDQCSKYSNVKGVAKCMDGDEYSENMGRYISETKAQAKHREKLVSDYEAMAQDLIRCANICRELADKHGDSYDDSMRKLRKVREDR